MDDAIRQLAQWLGDARHVAVLTGAGISAESGLRTFRGVTASTAAPPPTMPGNMAALWKDFDPATLATPEAFARDPELVTRWYDWRRLGCLAAEPNPGHLALAELERRLTERSGKFILLTQNVDRLHHRAGSTNVVELHGSIIVWRCVKTRREVEPGPDPFDRFPPASPFATGPGAILRPSVVWFGEPLPREAVEAASDAAERCDLFISVGTSSVVYPAAGFIQEAARRGARTAEINLEPTPISQLVDLSIRARAGEALPAVVAASQ